MKRIRRGIGFALAVVATSVLGAVAHSQFVVATVSGLGHPVPLGDRLAWAGHDAVGMFGTYAPIIAIGFLIAFPIAALVVRRLPHLRNIGYTLAGAIAIVAALVLMKQLLDITGIASTRSALGIATQTLAGAVGGWIFAMTSEAQELSVAN